MLYKKGKLFQKIFMFDLALMNNFILAEIIKLLVMWSFSMFV